MKKLKIGLAAAALALGGLFAVAALANAADYGVDMDQTCQIQHGLTWKSKLLDSGNAYSWRCRS